MAMYANTIEKATHRYATNICWGAGYFNDGYRYIIAESDEDAEKFTLRNITDPDIQKKLSDHTWEYI